MGNMPNAALLLAIASLANTRLEENSKEILLRGVLKKPQSLLRRRTLTTLQTILENTVQRKSSMILQGLSKCRTLKRHEKKETFRGCSLLIPQ